MEMNYYQSQAHYTAVYPDIGNNVVYPTLGLTGEAGEVAEKVKKLIRDHNGQLTPEYAADIKKELGDCLWYLSQVANEIGVTLEDVAQTNLEKLALRQQHDLIHGNGDNREVNFYKQ